jgi:aminoglycoside phosphotransferase (APT) family kinase protein
VHCTDESVIGAEFYVMERVKGIILRSQICRRTGPRCSRTEACARASSTVRRAAPGRLQRLRPGDLGKPEGYVARQIKGWSDRYEKP